MPQYQAYGLRISSDLPLPELVSSDDKADISITINVVSKPSAANDYAPIQCLSASPERVHLVWNRVGDLQIENGQHISIIPHPDADEDALRLFVLGAGLGVLLYQRGILLFHASSVLIRNYVVGFIGAKGWGKSTTAAALQKRGHSLVSDELLAIDFASEQTPLALPGAQFTRLWVDAALSLGGTIDDSTRVRVGIDKYNIVATASALQKQPLHHLYLLDAGSGLSVQPIRASEAFFSVLPHLYVFRFGASFLQATGFDQSFQQLKLLLQQVSVKRLIRQHDLNQLDAIAQLVEQDTLSTASPVS